MKTAFLMKTTFPNLATLLVLGATAAALFADIASADEEEKRPNLVFLLTDDHRADQLGCYGNEILETPHIDRLAAGGTLFERAAITSAICTPSRVCFFLGQYERKHGVNFNSGTAMSASAWAKSYPVLLREAGYFTGYVGKNHVPIGAKGYDTGLMERSFDFWFGGHGHLGFYPKKRHALLRLAEADTQVEILEEGALQFLDADEAFLAGADDFLRRRPGDRPFCLSIAFNLPHAAGASTMELRPSDPALYRTAYRDRIDTLPLPEHYLPRAEIESPRLPGEVLRTEFRQPSYDYVDTAEALRERLVRQYQTVTGIDRLVGSLRARLDELGLAENTVIVLASDHGIMAGEFGLGGKALNYEVCLRIPLIVHDPRVPESARGQRRDELVLGLDVPSTLLGLAGVPAPDTFQGRDLSPLVRGESPASDDSDTWRDAVFAENLWSTYFGNPRIESVRTAADWKYLRYFANDHTVFEGQDSRARYGVTAKTAALYAHWLDASIEGEKPVHEELFHLAADPHEAHNLADDPDQGERLDTMRALADRLVREARGGEGRPDTVRLGRE